MCSNQTVVIVATMMSIKSILSISEGEWIVRKYVEVDVVSEEGSDKEFTLLRRTEQD